MKSVKIHCEPELVNPCLVAAWPGIGNVALIAATYLKDKLAAEEFGEIEPSGFFDISGVFVKDNIVEALELPESKFYYWHSGGQGKDTIIFLSEAQPAFGAYEYACMVLDVAERFGVKRIYTLAAALTEHHSDQPRVLGAASSPELLEELEKLHVVQAGNFYIAGLNGLLLGALPVNVIGCFIAGLFWGILKIMPVSPSVYLFLLVGLCGGFTTFSSYMLETMLLGRHALPWALLNIIVSTSGGFVALYLGVLCSRFWVG